MVEKHLRSDDRPLDERCTQNQKMRSIVIPVPGDVFAMQRGVHMLRTSYVLWKWMKAAMTAAQQRQSEKAVDKAR